ncbi:hypothetical protein KKZ03_02945 [Methylobacter sp. S3L5C]|nr:hypothetical protein KKZ03_02945 [Methylobacter sp. S3L5C]
MPKDTLQITGQRLCEQPLSKMELRWQVVEQLTTYCRKHLRPLYCALDFSSTVPDNPWLGALTLMKGVFAKQQRLSLQPMNECLEKTVSPRLRCYLLVIDTEGKTTACRLTGTNFGFIGKSGNASSQVSSTWQTASSINVSRMNSFPWRRRRLCFSN